MERIGVLSQQDVERKRKDKEANRRKIKEQRKNRVKESTVQQKMKKTATVDRDQFI